MRIEKCYFCSGPIYPGHGIVFIRNDSKMFRFCRSKCHKHFKAKHNPRKMRWTKAYRKSHGKEMIVDSTFEFEKKRNEPQKYNREVMVQTVQAMKKVAAVKKRRETKFYIDRMKKAKVRLNDVIQEELQKHITLVSEPATKKKIEEYTLEKETAKEQAKQVQMETRKSKKRRLILKIWN